MKNEQVLKESTNKSIVFAWTSIAMKQGRLSLLLKILIIALLFLILLSRLSDIFHTSNDYYFINILRGLRCTDFDNVQEADRFKELPQFHETPEFACISKHRDYFGLDSFGWGEAWMITADRNTVLLGKDRHVYSFKKSNTVGSWRQGQTLAACSHVDDTRMHMDLDASGQTLVVACWTDSGDDWGPRPHLEALIFEQKPLRGFWNSQRIFSIQDTCCNNLGVTVKVTSDGRLVTLRYHEMVPRRRLDFSEDSSYECRPAVRVFEKTALGSWEEHSEAP